MIFHRALAPRRVSRWLRGRWSLAALLGLGGSDRDDLLWQAARLTRAGSYEDALRLYDLVAVLWPEAESSALLGRGVCLQFQGALDLAERAYDAVLQAQPENVYARTNRAEVRLLQGRDQAAGDDLTLALAALARQQGPAALKRRVQTLHQRAFAREPIAPAAVVWQNPGSNTS